MPLIFTRDQIRSYLHDQGYAVNESELDAFIHDLKRVVKHEDRKRRRKRLGHEPDDTRLDTTTSATSSPDEGEYYLFEDLEEEDEGVHSSAESPLEHEESSFENSEELVSQSVKFVPNASKPKLYSPKESSHVERLHEGKTRSQKSPKESRAEKSPKGSNRVEMSSKENIYDEKPHKSSSRIETSPRKHSFPESKRENKIEKVPSKSSYVVMNRRTMTWNENNEPVVVDSKVPIPIDVPDKPKERKKKLSPLSSTSNIVRRKVDISPGPGALNKPSSNTEKENISSTSFHSLPKSSSGSTPNTDELLALLENILPESDDTDPDSGDGVRKRPIGPPDHIKRDPVALYHYYKNFWDKQKLPGHNRHMKLRWNVRAQTVGTYPCMNGQPIKYLRQ